MWITFCCLFWRTWYSYFNEQEDQRSIEKGLGRRAERGTQQTNERIGFFAPRENVEASTSQDGAQNGCCA